MIGSDLIDLMRDALWVILKLAGPVLLTSLAVGVAVAFIQALTQIQEMTLTFVPKILAIGLVVSFLMPFMGKMIEAFAERVFDRIVVIEPVHHPTGAML